MLDAVDLAILVLVVLAAIGGYRRGVVPSFTQYGGLFAGALLASAGSAWILDALGLEDPNSRPLVAGLLLLLGACIGATVGFWVGEPLRSWLLGLRRPRWPDRAAGAAVSLLAVLVMAWFLSLSLAASSDGGLSSLVQRSTVLRGIDQVVPEPPGFLVGVERTVADVPFPSTFFPGHLADLPEPLAVPSVGATGAVESAASQVYRVAGAGCGGLVTGSAYPVAPDYVATNAHVVAGTRDTRVSQDQRGIDLEATTVFFDEQVDVAILHVPGLDATPLGSANAARGVDAFVVGYPGGGQQTITAAAVDGETLARFDDIYNEGEVTRQIWVFNGTVRPGNSGGPLLDANGKVLGMVFAASSHSGSTQAYALTDQQLQSDVASGLTKRTAVNTAAMACAV